MSDSAPSVDVSAAVTDGDLRAWRDAATAGGLPAPGTERWQPLRAGVVNMWEFDVAEIWFADGNAQLKGLNESGKSTLMVLTTLMLLAGDTSPQYIDTMGTTNKRFRYYVEPSGEESDRREPTTSANRGWCWMEYGRRGPGGDEFVTTLLHAATQRAQQSSTKVTWVVAEGRARVRDGLTLVRGNTVVPPADVSDDDSVIVCGTGAEYRDRVARVIFDAPVEHLDAVVRMLKVIRTPKLGTRLNPAFLRESLRDALPPLAPKEIRQLADGWEQLEQIAAERDSAEEARLAVERFIETAWQPWASAEVRRAADAVVRSSTRFDDVTRKTRLAREDLDNVQRETTEVEAQLERIGAELDENDGRQKALRSSARYRDATSTATRAEELREQRDDQERQVKEQVERCEAAKRSRELAVTERESARVDVEDAGAALEAAAGSLHDACRDAGLTHAPGWISDGEPERIGVAARERRGAIRALRALHLEVKRTADRAEGARNAASEADQRHRGAEEEADGCASRTSRAAQDLLDRLAGWATGGLVQIDAALLAQWAATIDTMVDTPPDVTPVPLLATTVHRDLLDGLRTSLEVEHHRLGEEARRLSDELDELDQRIAAVEAERDPVPAPPQGWSRRDRPAAGADGAPLWLLVEPTADLDQAGLDLLEAALAATGLLDAWLSPEGRWRTSDGDDLVALGGNPVEPNLATVLAPAGDLPPSLRHSVEQVLNSVAYLRADTADGPNPGVWIAEDGRFHTPTLEGRAGTDQHGAVLLGAAARRQHRERRLTELRSEHDGIRAAAAVCATQLEDLTERSQILTSWAADLPSDVDLVASVTAHLAAQRRVEELSEQLVVAQEREALAQTAHDDARAAAAEFEALHQLPHDTDRLDDVAEAVEEAIRRLDRFTAAGLVLRAARNAHDQAAGRLTFAEETEQREEKVRYKTEAALAKIAHELQLAEDALSGDVVDTLAEMQHLEDSAHQLGKQRDEATERLRELDQRKGSAEQQLATREDEEEAARAEREQQVTRWFTIVDTGLPSLLDIADPPARTVSGALNAARAARAAIEPRAWPPSEDTDGQAERCQRAWKQVVTATTPLNATLLGSSRRSVQIHESDDRDLPSLQIVIDASGAGFAPPEAVRRLAHQYEVLRTNYDESMHRTLHELLGSTFIEHLRSRLQQVADLHARINDVFADHPTGATRTTLRVRRVPAEGDTTAARVLEFLEGSSYSLLTPEAQAEVRTFLQLRIDEARAEARDAGDSDWYNRLATALDYRRWFDTTIELRAGETGTWKPMTVGTHGRLSGGAGVVTLMLPLVATVAALYSSCPSGPRLLWLDEAFDGVDAVNRSSLLGMLHEFDMDWLLAGPGLLVNTATVRHAAIWDVVRADHPQPGVTLELSLWSAGRLELLDVPDAATLDTQPATNGTSP
jgi:uncharacterized protein (TIGR02680 family)